MQFSATSTKARTAVGKQEECLPCDSPVITYKREGAWQGSGHKLRMGGTEEKHNSENHVFPAHFKACIDRSGVVPTYKKKVCL